MHRKGMSWNNPPPKHYYRFLQVEGGGTIYEENLTHFSFAYKLCEPSPNEDMELWTVKSFHDVLDALHVEAREGNRTPTMLVSYRSELSTPGRYISNFIQYIPHGINTPLPIF